MHIYLPIAETSLNVLLLLALGGGVGVISGVFGVGGGFLLTPLLITVGIPPDVAVATGANQILGSSVSGVLGHWHRGNVDVKMGIVLVLGGLVGALAGVWLLGVLRRLGQIDLAINLSYVVLLGVLGALMLVESVVTLVRSQRGAGARKKAHQHYMLHRLPIRMRFPRSRVYMSALLPAGLGMAVGIMTAIMGVGGGFVLVPAMIYLLGVPTAVTVGTSLFQIAFVSAAVTFLQAVSHDTVDVMLALVLVLGGVIGAQLGTHLGAKLRGEQLRALLALIVLAVCAKIAYGLVRMPVDLYSLQQQ